MELRQRLLVILDQMKRICESVYQQRYLFVINTIGQLTVALQEVSEDLLHSTELCVDMEYYVQVLSDVLQAQQQEDYILFADLLEGQMIPLLLQCQQQLLVMNSDSVIWYDCNMGIVKKQDRYRKLYDQLKRYQDNRLAGDEKVSISVEMTGIGAMTMLGECAGTRRYFHSNIDPFREARLFASSLKPMSLYNIFGFGLGYHVEQIARMYSAADVCVFEPNLEVIYQAFCRMDLQWLLNNPKVKICYDPYYQGVMQQLEENADSVVLHYPSVDLVPEMGIRERFMDIRIRRENMMAYEQQFEQNMRSNFKNIHQSVEELKPQFEGKRIVIVAGGPSLDNNIQLLKKIDKESCRIFAVGAVLRRLLKEGIIPDYAIITDPKSYTVGQIQGMEDCGVPMLIMSTAIDQIALQYHGPKYLICQEGMPEAEEYAKQKGYMIFQTGGSVATTALDVSIRLGAGDIAFVGLDLAFIGKRTHAQDVAGGTIDDGIELSKVVGWHGESLATNRPFTMYRQWIERRLMQEDVTMPVYDATEGGARKEGMIPIRLGDWIEKKG